MATMATPTLQQIQGDRRSGFSRPTRARLLGLHVFFICRRDDLPGLGRVVEDHKLRREVLAHGVLAFFFNVVIVALTINIVAGLI